MANDRSEPTTSKDEGGGLVGVISATGAILVVGLGLVFVFVMALVSLGTIPDSQKSTVVTSALPSSAQWSAHTSGSERGPRARNAPRSRETSSR